MGKKRTIEVMIQDQQARVDKAKAKYNKELQILKELQKKKDENKNRELLEAVAGSGKNFEEIMEFLKK